MKFLPIEATMHSATNQENETSSAEWCRYPIGKTQENKWFPLLDLNVEPI